MGNRRRSLVSEQRDPFTDSAGDYCPTEKAGGPGDRLVDRPIQILTEINKMRRNGVLRRAIMFHARQKKGA
jgi:hypothetical protein